MYNNKEYKFGTALSNFSNTQLTQPNNFGVMQPNNFGTTQPGTFGTQPGTFGTQPGTFGTTQPGTFGTQPGTFGTTQPGTFGTTQPGTFGTTQPGTFGTQPGTFGTTQPGTFGTQPGTFGVAQPTNFASNFERPLNNIQKVECQVSLKMDSDIVKNSLDEIVIKPRLSKIKKSDITLESNFTKNIKINCCTVMISNDSKQLIKNCLIGGVSIIKDHTKIEIITKVQNFIRFVNTDPITINHNCLLSQLHEKYLLYKPECIYVVNEVNKCIGMVTKNDIEISIMISLDGNVLVYQIMQQIDNYFSESEYDWKELMKSPNSEMLSKFRNTRAIPIVNGKEEIISEFILENLSNYYKKKNTILFNKKGKIFIGVQITVDNYTDINSLIEKGVNLLYLECSNVYNENIYNMIKQIKITYPEVIVMIGKILTGETYKYFSDSGVDCISVGDSSEIGHLNKLYECKQEYKNTKIPIISNSGTINDANIYKVLAGGANCVMISELSDTTIDIIKSGLNSINISDIESLYNENIEIYKYI